MNGELAQAIALVAWGNRARGSASAPPAHLASENSTFRYVRSLAFTTTRHGMAADVAATPEDWFAWLAGRGVTRLRLAARVRTLDFLAGRMAAALAGGGEWHVLEDFADDSPGYWTPEWTFGDRSSATPWNVRYTFSRGRPFPYSALSLDEARAALETALTAVADVAATIGATVWLETFREAMSQLRSASPRAPYHDDALPPDGYSLSARQLFAAAVGAWVFGGMGSWNDIGVPDNAMQHRYQTASDALYAAILDSFPAVLDSSSG